MSYPFKLQYPHKNSPDSFPFTHFLAKLVERILVKYQNIFPLVCIRLLLITSSLDYALILCGSKNYPYMYLPHRRDFSLDPPPLWKFQSSFKHLLTFGPLRTPYPQGISNPFRGGSMDIFWNYTLLGEN